MTNWGIWNHAPMSGNCDSLGTHGAEQNSKPSEQLQSVTLPMSLENKSKPNRSLNNSQFDLCFSCPWNTFHKPNKCSVPGPNANNVVSRMATTVLSGCPQFFVILDAMVTRAFLFDPLFLSFILSDFVILFLFPGVRSSFADQSL